MKTEVYIATENGSPELVTCNENKIPKVNDCFWVGNRCFEVLDKHTKIQKNKLYEEVYRVQLQVTKIAESRYPNFF